MYQIEYTTIAVIPAFCAVIAPRNKLLTLLPEPEETEEEVVFQAAA
jgi:hypothetical protein